MLHVDTSKLPFLVIRETGVELTDAELENTLQRLDGLALCWAPHPLALILDIRKGRVPPMSQRHMLQQRLNRKTSLITSCAVLMHSGTFQYLISALLWKARTPYPIYECLDEDEAWSWSHKMLEEAGHTTDEAHWERLRDEIVPDF